MKTINMPETLQEFRDYYKDRDIKEIKVRDNHPYNSRTIGYQLIEGTSAVAQSTYLITAYKNLWKKEIM